MELERYIKRFSQSLETCYIKDITTIVNEMFKEYDILYKNTDEQGHGHTRPGPEPQVIIQKFRSAFRSESVTNICKGVSQNGNRCYRKITGNSGDYCKTHEYLAFKNKTTLPTSKVYIISNHNVHDNPSYQHTIRPSTNDYANNDDNSSTDKILLCTNSRNICLNEDNENYKKHKEHKNLNLKQQLIQDTFYYVDSEYIYDKQSMQRVGYVETTQSDYNYVLTDDPFVLGLF